MSRTRRRTKDFAVQRWVGGLDEYLLYETNHSCVYYGHSYDDILTDEHRAKLTHDWQQKVSDYHRDCRSGRYGIPRWYRHMHGTRRARRFEKAALHTCHHYDEWDVHQPDRRMRDSMYYYWW